jgi:hypothetical protein
MPWRCGVVPSRDSIRQLEHTIREADKLLYNLTKYIYEVNYIMYTRTKEAAEATDTEHSYCLVSQQ